MSAFLALRNYFKLSNYHLQFIGDFCACGSNFSNTPCRSLRTRGRINIDRLLIDRHHVRETLLSGNHAPRKYRVQVSAINSAELRHSKLTRDIGPARSCNRFNSCCIGLYWTRHKIPQLFKSNAQDLRDKSCRAFGFVSKRCFALNLWNEQRNENRTKRCDRSYPRSNRRNSFPVHHHAAAPRPERQTCHRALHLMLLSLAA